MPIRSPVLDDFSQNSPTLKLTDNLSLSNDTRLALRINIHVHMLFHTDFLMGEMFNKPNKIFVCVRTRRTRFAETIDFNENSL